MVRIILIRSYCSTLINQLLIEYKPEAEALCLSVADALKTTVDNIDNESGKLVDYEWNCLC
jgi:hypothetical protein